MKKHFKIYWIKFIIGIVFVRGSFKHLVPYDNLSSIQRNYQQRILAPNQGLIRLVVDSPNIIQIEEFQGLLERVVKLKQKCLDTLKDVKSLKDDLDSFQAKNNIRTTSQLSKLEASLLDVYTKKLVKKQKEGQQYYQDYLSQKKEMSSFVEKIPENQKAFFKNFLNQLKELDQQQYSEDFKIILTYEIDLLKIHFFSDSL